ncbi:hypothetical protein [Acinetobacter sp.]|uniref:hypothetical protein n=1 Tax=Acinetobacter sp. TaxID=472 RepID=UPI0035B17DD4
MFLAKQCFSFAKIRSKASQGKHLAAQCASPRNLFTFCTQTAFVAKTVYFKDHRFALHCKQSSALFLPLRLALRIKAVLLFLLRLRMTLPRIKENLKFKNKMPVNFLTNWH